MNHPTPVTCEGRRGGPLNVEQIGERLDELGVVEYDGDRDLGDRKRLSSPDGWTYATHYACDYVDAMIRGWKTDPVSGRHPWLLNVSVRIAAAHRYGCLTREQHDRAITVAVNRFREECARPGDARPIKLYEIADLRAEGIRRAAAKTEEALATEIGGPHAHLEEYQMSKAKTAAALQNTPPTDGSTALAPAGLHLVIDEPEPG